MGLPPAESRAGAIWAPFAVAVLVSLHAGLAWSAGHEGAAQQAARQAPAEASTYQAIIDRYCVACHNERLLTGNLTLDGAGVGAADDHPELWEKVLQKLQTQSMPPPGRPRPDAGTYVQFASWLETTLDAASAATPNPGRPTIHRLNRLEYTNAIRDLLGLEIDGETFLPSDDLAYGFDNNADILTVARGCWNATCRRRARSAVWRSVIRRSNRMSRATRCRRC